MRERPILFNDVMVRVLMSGAKTQTRRVAKGVVAMHARTGEALAKLDSAGPRVLCPFGQPGDRLWVREAHAIFQTHGQHRADGERWGPWGGLPSTVSDDGKQIAYYREGFDRCDPGRWRPSIHMPRWASRLVLEITDVRVERLQAISDGDALAEGIEELNGRFTHNRGKYGCRSACGAFVQLWESTGGNWDSNPWVWVIEFKRLEVRGV